jgi:pimeloyl-ACP methyl ester carboxylesterase
MEQRFETVAGIRGHARVSGVGPPIVLVHGLAVSSLYFVPLARRLALRYAVLAPDLPGYGLSATPARPLDVTELADALVDWLDLAGIESAPLVGNSLGCQIAVDLAVRAPDRVRRLVLVGPTMDPSAPTLRAQALRLARDAILEPIGLNIVELRDYVRMGPRRILATARFALADQFAAKLKGVRQPTLVVRGERDQIVTQEWAERVASVLPQGRLHVVRGSPHATHWDAADEVARLVEEFA